MASFDECFNVNPNTRTRPADYEKFWQNQLNLLKKIPIELETEKKTTRKILTETSYSLKFQSIGKYRLQAQYLSPRKFIKKPPLIVIFPDYNKENVAYKGLLNAGFAQLVLRLRGHENKAQKQTQPETMGLVKPAPRKGEERPGSYGYFAENLSDPSRYYMTQLMLDAFRTVEAARLRKDADTSRIGIWGQGTGAVMALFVAKYMGRANSLFLESPGFSFLELTQNLSDADYAHEINDYTRSHRKFKNQIKQNLAYNDAMYLADNLSTPTGMSLGLQDKEAPAQGGFAVFHLLSGEKDMFLNTEALPSTALKDKKLVLQNAVKFFTQTLTGADTWNNDSQTID